MNRYKILCGLFSREICPNNCSGYQISLLFLLLLQKQTARALLQLIQPHQILSLLVFEISTEEWPINADTGLLRRSLPTRGAAGKPISRPSSKIQNQRER